MDIDEKKKHYWRRQLELKNSREHMEEKSKQFEEFEKTALPIVKEYADKKASLERLIEYVINEENELHKLKDEIVEHDWKATN